MNIKKILFNQSGSLLRTIIYTLGHFIIAAACVMYFTGASVYAGMTAVSYTHLRAHET